MINMSHCMFRNTLLALQECAAQWEGDEEGLSQEERQARDDLLQLCYVLVEEHTGDDDE